MVARHTSAGCLVLLAAAVVAACSRKIDESTTLPLAPQQVGVLLREAFAGRGGWTLVELPARQRRDLAIDLGDDRPVRPASIDGAPIDGSPWFFLVGAASREVTAWRRDAAVSGQRPDTAIKVPSFAPSMVVASATGAIAYSREVSSEVRLLSWRPHLGQSKQLDPFSAKTLVPACVTSVGANRWLAVATLGPGSVDGSDPNAEAVVFDGEGAVLARRALTDLSAEVGSPLIGPSACVGGRDRAAVLFSGSQNLAALEISGDLIACRGAVSVPLLGLGSDGARMALLPDGRIAIPSRVSPDLALLSPGGGTARVLRLSESGNAVALALSADEAALLVLVADEGSAAVVAFFLDSEQEIPVVRLTASDVPVDLAVAPVP